MTVGETIRYYRKEKGFTQKQLGELCGINEANIRKYESGRQNAKVETLQKISNALELPVATFLPALAQNVQEKNKQSLDSILTQKEEQPSLTDLIALLEPENLQDYLNAKSVIIEAEISTRQSDLVILAEILALLKGLNKTGQQKALEHLRDLMKIPEYQKTSK